MITPKVVLLCGGLGTRLREETEYRPKPMVEVGGRPIIWHLMKIHAQQGFSEFVLALGYKGNAFREYFLNYEAMNSDFTVTLGPRTNVHLHDAHGETGYRVTLAETGAETMTGGRIRRCARYLDGTFLATYGDGLADIDLRKLWQFHRSHGKLATVTVARPRSRFGLIEIDERGQVQRFTEKPVMDNWVNIGFFVFEPKVLEYLGGGDSCILEREPLERLAAEGQLCAYQHDGFFFAMDTYREYKELNEIWASGQAPWKIW